MILLLGKDNAVVMYTKEILKMNVDKLAYNNTLYRFFKIYKLNKEKKSINYNNTKFRIDRSSFEFRFRF